MNKPQTEEKPIVNIERSPLFLGLMALTSVLLCTWCWWLLRNVNPAGFFVMVPAAALTLQTGWLLLNPFAMVFDSRLEIRQSWFHHKFRYFNDLDKLSEDQSGTFYITYTDGEVEKLNLFGIRGSQRQLLKENCRKQITESAARRT